MHKCLAIAHLRDDDASIEDTNHLRKMKSSVQCFEDICGQPASFTSSLCKEFHSAVALGFCVSLHRNVLIILLGLASQPGWAMTSGAGFLLLLHELPLE